MKNNSETTNSNMKTLIKTAATLITFTLLTISISLAQNQPPPPNGGNAPGSGNTPVGGDAPLTGGLGILLSLGAAYGTKKVYQFNNNENE